MKKECGLTSVELVVTVIVLLGSGGWIANIVKLAGCDFAHITGLTIIRAIGVFMPPLGAILGFI